MSTVLKAAVFGSSYVTRLQQFCDGDLKNPAIDCRFFGRGGMRADRIPMDLMRKVDRFHPDIVIIQLGGNDIGYNSSPRDIFDNLCLLEEQFTQMVGCKVFVTEIVQRGNLKKSPGLTQCVFNKQRAALNKLLKKHFGKCFVTLNVKFPKDYDNGLVHFSETGLRKSFHIIRRILAM